MGKVALRRKSSRTSVRSTAFLAWNDLSDHCPPVAESEIANAVAWIAEHSPVAAARWLEGIRQAMSTLREMPSRCPVAGDDFDSEVIVRQLLYGRRRNRYRILFAVKGDTVQVLHVRHGARAPIRR